ncbi:NADH:ubiquinone reductase (Na(+)-transporting) subunit C [Alistipes sp. OttesenSCG-928-B03]|nr:NADH:ubiquinone reductase (Na(+)-transporting) subunit C [Alistipes sp. OttesenSCG-928-B03]
MNRNNNTYIIVYATVMVVVVALVLAFASLKLQPLQNANVENETKGAILTAIGEEGEMNTVKDKTAYINERYAKYIVEDFAVDCNGNRVEGANAFDILKNLKAEYAKPEEQRQLPVFVSRSDDGRTRYVLPLWGAGLWGPVWGYLALEDDWDTIYGAVFDHKSETPGLGAEIATPGFQDQFRGKTIFRNGQFVSIGVTKGVGSSAGNPNAVDAISGGTITSRGVEKMLRDNLTDYKAFIEKQKSGLLSEGGAIAGAEASMTTLADHEAAAGGAEADSIESDGLADDDQEVENQNNTNTESDE